MFTSLVATALTAIYLNVVFASSHVTPGILLIGDSTVTDSAGWGAGFCADTKNLMTCTNLAVSGTTTISWQLQMQYQMMLSSCKTAKTYATIQFGHNDQKVMNTSTFYASMLSLTNKVKAAGCSPIMVTSLARRTFSGGVLTDILGPYADETISVSKNLGLPLLPLLADSMAYISKLGEPDAMKFDKDYNPTTGTYTDTTHLNMLGSLYFGRIVADEVMKYIPGLAPYIVANATLSAKISAGTL